MDAVLRVSEYRPLVGLTVSYDFSKNRPKYYIPADYAEVIHHVGGVPVLLPPIDSRDAVKEFVGRIDCLLLTGGGDIDPYYFGEEPLPGLGEVDPVRDGFEIDLIHCAFQQGLPILGICRGMQVLATAMGGALYQDIHSQVQGALQHQQKAPYWAATHTITVENDTRLAAILRCREARVNSFHHQAVAKCGSQLVVAAQSKDGLIEAVEGTDKQLFVLGVQWHPEMMWKYDDISLGIFRSFVESAFDARTKRC